MNHTGGFQPTLGKPTPAHPPSIPPEGVEIVTTGAGSRANHMKCPVCQSNCETNRTRMKKRVILWCPKCRTWAMP